MRALSKGCMDVLEDAALPCDIASMPNADAWEWENNFYSDDEAEQECTERGLTVVLPCLACLQVFEDEHCNHHHLTSRGIEALSFYREHKELLK